LTSFRRAAMLARPFAVEGPRMPKRFLIALAGLVIVSSGCGSTKTNPFAPVPECKGDAVLPLGGSRQLVFSSLALADTTEGFDLDGNGSVDNKLGLLGALANPQLVMSFKQSRDVIIAVEVFDYTGAASDMCVKSAFYLGSVNKDRDGDGKTTAPRNSDCLDIDASVPRAEILDNRLDDDCDGYADNATKDQKPTSNTEPDGDGDRVTIAQGDCDDRNDTPEHLELAKSRYPGAKDLCDDGIDQNCDGIVDNDPSCDPFGDNNVQIQIAKESFVDPAASPLVPYIEFNAGTVTSNLLKDGPSLFRVTIPLDKEQLALELTGARLEATLADDGSKLKMMSGRLGGVLSASTLAQITGLELSSFVKKEQSLLDALFTGAGTSLLGLEADKDGHYQPDIDVDGDGLESFWTENLSAPTTFIDFCKDGDGTVVKSEPGKPCALAKDAKGNYRFLDGLSVALKWTAVPARFDTKLVSQQK